MYRQTSTRLRHLLSLLPALVSIDLPAATPAPLAPYSAVMAQAPSPTDFVLDKFKTHDLLIFDDAMHTAAEPWRFYIALVKNSAFHSQVRNIFIETLPVIFQPAINAYLASPVDDRPSCTRPCRRPATWAGPTRPISTCCVQCAK